jgi:RNase P subunit RPR2
MICDRCGTIIRGKADQVFIETGSGVSATVLLCPGSCRPEARQRYPQDPRSRQRRRPLR